MEPRLEEKARVGGASPATGHNQSSHSQFMRSVANDQRLLSLDFLCEVGDSFVTLGAALCAAASAENLPVIELALQQLRATLIEGIAEYKTLAADNAGGAQ